MRIFSLFLILITVGFSSEMVKAPTKFLGVGKSFNAKELNYLKQSSEFPKSFTVETWIYPKDLTKESVDVISHRKEEVPTDFRLFLNKKNIVYGYYSKKHDRWRRVVLKNALVENRWHHIAVTKELDGKVNFYINGDNYNMGAVDESIDVDNKTWTIGCHVNKLDCFHGYLDEIRVWNYARNKEEIQANFRKPLEDKSLILRESFETQKTVKRSKETATEVKISKKTVVQKKVTLPAVPKAETLKVKVVQEPKKEVETKNKPQVIKESIQTPKKVTTITTPVKKEELSLNKKRTFYYSIGANVESGTFKNELQNTSGIFDVATVNNSSQNQSGKGLELTVGTDLEEFKVGGFYNQIKWDNASTKTVGLFIKKEFEKLDLGDVNVDSLASFKVGKTDFSLDGFAKESDTSYSVSGGVKYESVILSLGYNFIDMDVSKKYAIGGTALHKVNYKGGFFLGLSYEGIFE